MRTKYKLTETSKNKLHTGDDQRQLIEEWMARFSSLPELNPNIFVETDMTGNVCYLNPSAKTLFPDLQTAGTSHPWTAELGPVVDEFKKGLKYFSRVLRIEDLWYQQVLYYDEETQRIKLYGWDITKLKETNEWNARLAAIVESSDDAIIGKDLNGTIIVWNKGAERIYGYAAREVIGRSISILVPPGHADEVSKLLDEISRGKTVEHFETVRLKKDGSRINVSLTISPIKDGSGTITGASTIARDITGQKRSEEALRSSQFQLAHAIDLARIVYWEHDPTDNMLIFNDAFYAFYGTTAEREGGYRMAREEYRKRFVHPDDQLWNAQIVEQNLASYGSEALPDLEHRIVRRDGEVRHILVRTGVIKDDSGCVIKRYGASQDITERKKAEETLQKSEARLRKFYESGLIGVVYWNMDGAITDANDKFLEIVGYTREELKEGKIDWKNMTPAEYRHLDEDSVAELKATGVNMAPLEKEYIRKDGARVPVMVAGAMFDETRFDGVAFVQDITERKQADDALREARDRAQEYLDVAGVVLMALDTDCCITLINRKGCELLGYEEGELIGKNFIMTFIPSDVRGETMSVFQKLMNGEIEPVAYHENPVLTKTGEQRIIAWHNTYLKDKEGNVSGSLSSGEDVTERKLAEENLTKSEQKYRDIFENAVEGIFQTLPDGRFISVNPALARMHGCETSEEMLMTISNVEQLYVDLNEKKKYQNLLKKHEIIKNFESQFCRKNGGIFWASLNARAVRDKDGRVFYYEGTVEDITYRKRAERQLRETVEKLKKSLDGTIQILSHTVEMRDPYTAGHQARVSELACAIAHEMSLSDHTVETIRMAGSIHDIGKLSVPAEILAKPTRLNELEMSLIKTHPQSGHNILEDSVLRYPIAEIIFQHHERLDGSGYPRGLKGEQILLEARIITVADVVEAMASHRPYRPSLGINVALEEIERNKGVFYDSKVADACLRLFREKGFKLN